MNLQENIHRIKEMIGLIIESSVPNENSLFDILKKNGFEKSTEDDFTNIIGGEIKLNNGWLYINKDTKIYVYKDGTTPKIYFKIKDGTVKRLEAFPVDQNIINDYITNPPKPKEKTLEDFKGEIEKVSDGFSDIVKKDDGYYYGENQDKKLPDNILLTIKNTIKSRLNQIKNECDGSSLSNVEKDEINKYIEGVKSKAKSLNLVESIHINMNLQENIHRIKQMMGILKEDTISFPVIVTGSFNGDNGDRSHAFQSTGGKPVGKMQTIVNQKLNEIYNKGYNPMITGIKVTINKTNKTTSWEVTINKSTDGKAYLGLVTVGSCCNSSFKTRADRQVDNMKTWNSKPENHKLITIIETTDEGKSNGYITVIGGYYKLKQHFYQYSKDNKPPHKSK